MPIKVTCNSCSGVLHAPDDSAGKRGRCPTCGIILNIPADAPRVSAEPIPAPAPTAAAGTYGIAPDQAFPRPPAFADDAKASFGARPMAPAQASRLPPDPRRYSDPFAKARKPAPVSADRIARKWARVHRGLGLVCWGVFLMSLGVIVPGVLAILETLSMLPDKTPGMLGVATVSQTDELKVAGALVFLILGSLLIVWGRYCVAAVPRESGARSVATASALAKTMAWVGMLVIVGIGVHSTLNNAPPKLIPQDIVLEPGLKYQDRVEKYLKQVFVSPDDVKGQVQRFGALALLAGGLIAELWFLGTLSRLAAFLRSNRALGRVNRFTIVCGLLALTLSGLWLACDLFGQAGFMDKVTANWNGQPPKTRTYIIASVVAGLALFFTILYCGSLRAIRRAIREAGPV